MQESKAIRGDFYRKMEKLLNLPANSVDGTKELSGLKNWDSLTILEFIVLADTDYKSDVQAGEIAGAKTVDDLAELTFARSALGHESIHSGN